jgi:hypothetical protein
MGSIKYIFLFLATAFLTSGCQKVITIDLNAANPQIVVEAQLSDQAGQDTVKLSKTASYFGDNVFPKISGAMVIITDDKGVADTLKEFSPGVYLKPGLKGSPLSTYFISIQAEGKSLNASSTMPAKILIDSLSVAPIKNPFRKVDGYRVSCHFQDPPHVANYYRLKEYVNDTLYEDVDGLMLYNDKYTDGSAVSLPVGRKLRIGDQVRVELICLDAKTYDFYSSLNATLNSAISVSPANPNSNFGSSALGYFGAYTVDTKSILVVK